MRCFRKCNAVFSSPRLIRRVIFPSKILNHPGASFRWKRQTNCCELMLLILPQSKSRMLELLSWAVRRVSPTPVLSFVLFPFILYSAIRNVCCSFSRPQTSHVRQRLVGEGSAHPSLVLCQYGTEISAQALFSSTRFEISQPSQAFTAWRHEEVRKTGTRTVESRILSSDRFFSRR